MLYFATPSILSAIAGIISLFVALHFFQSYKKNHTVGVKDLAFVFLFLSLHAFTLATISIFFLKQDLILGYGYALAIFFIYLTLASGVGMTVFRSHHIFRAHILPVRLFLILSGVLVFIFQIKNLNEIQIMGNQVVYWGDDPLVGWLTGGIALLYGLAWFYFFHTDSKLVSNTYLKKKMGILGLIGIILGMAGLISFTDLKIYLPENSAVILFIFAVLLTSIISLLPKTSSSLEGSQGEKLENLSEKD